MERQKCEALSNEGKTLQDLSQMEKSLLEFLCGVLLQKDEFTFGSAGHGSWKESTSSIGIGPDAEKFTTPSDSAPTPHAVEGVDGHGDHLVNAPIISKTEIQESRTWKAFMS